MDKQITNPRRKALRLNFNPRIYGTIAEIGAGQEVARRFFRAGGASGTVAKTISAYDMSVSDSFYGHRDDERYVSEERLKKMLDVEYNALIEVLSDKRDEKTCYFAFANTVEAINFQKDNEGQGWVGVKFQLKPKAKPNHVILHIRMLEKDTFLQQRSLGILGVNLIFACFNYYKQPNTFLRSLLDYLSNSQIEVDMIMMDGPELDYIDNRLLSVQLVKNGMTKATMFDECMQAGQPSDVFYDKNILVLRGSFRPITYVELDILKSSVSIFKKDIAYKKENTYVFCEISLDNLLSEGDLDERDFLNRADILCGLGLNVMISNFKQHYEFVQYFSQFKIKKLRVITGVLTLNDILNEKYYKDLKGGILEAFGKLFINKMKLYVYPAKQEGTDEVLNSSNIVVPEEIKYLYRHLIQHRKILDITDVEKDKLHIFSGKVLELIKQNDESWIEMVPKYVSDKIKLHKMFGYKA